MGWVIRQGQHGLLVRPNDVNALAGAIAQLSRQPQQRRQLGQAGALALRSVFHIRPIAVQIAALYREFGNAGRDTG
ncbi:MAG: hypothetical protein R3F37_10735 [Candidatus Competibacteraceae bacterium]